MTQGDELLAAIRANENDDQARLIYADWLEQQGNLARANLIRRQCELATTPAWSRAAAEARWEVEHLLAQHGDAWRGELTKIGDVTWLDFERGFVTSIRIRDAMVLYVYGDEIRAAAPVHTVEMSPEISSPDPGSVVPWLRTLRLRLSWDLAHLDSVRPLLPSVRVLEFPDAGDDQSEVLARLARHLQLEELAVLGEHTMGSGLVNRLGEHPIGTNLRRLDVGTSFIDEDTGYFADPTLRYPGAQALAQLGLEHVEELSVSFQRITNAGFETVIGSVPKLRDFDVRGCELTDFPHLNDPGPAFIRFRASNNPIGDSAARILVEAPRLARCEVLDLATCELGDAALRALVAAPCWQTLCSLDLARNPLGMPGAIVLARSETPRQLHRLILEHCDLDEGAARTLASCRWLDQLTELDLRKNAVSAHALAKLDAIRVLALAGTTLVDDDLDYLGPLWPHLIHADLRGLPCGALLASAPDLQTLRLAGCGLDAAAIERLAGASFPRLRILDLSEQPISAASLATILESPLGQIPKLVLANTKLDAQAITYLATRGAAGVKELDLGRNELPIAQLLELGRSTVLKGVTLRLNGSPWNHPPKVRTELAQLLGETWFHYHTSFPEDEVE